MTTKVLINLAPEEVLVPEGNYLVEVDSIAARVSNAGYVYTSPTPAVLTPNDRSVSRSRC